MGVNFQNNAQYREAKRFYEDNKIGVGTAQGIHSKNGYWGMMITQLLPQLLMGGVQLATNYCSDYNVTDTKSVISSFIDLRNEYESAATDEDKKAAAKKLKEYAEDHDDNPTVWSNWKVLRADVNKLIS